MYVMKNALKNISRAKGRSFLIFVLILVISVSSCVALSIKGSADDAKEQAYENMSITGSISIDREAMMSSLQEGGGDRTEMMSLMQQSLSLEEQLVFAESQNVEDFYYSASIGLSIQEVDEDDEDAVAFQAYESDEVSVENNDPMSMSGRNSKGGMGSENPTSGSVSSDFTITGYSSHDAMSEFVTGTITILEGSVFDVELNANEVVISEEIAYLNELEINSEFTLVNPLQEEEEITFKVVGIFECTSTDAYANNMFVSYNSLEGINLSSQEAETILEYTRNEETIEVSSVITFSATGTYVFSDIERYELFEGELEGMGLDTGLYQLLSMDLESFESSVIPLENLSDFTLMFFFVVLAIGGIILIIFNLFTVRERKYEIGVLAAIGMQKFKVAMQFIIEVVVITFAAIIIGSGIGAGLSQPIADNLLASQIEAIEAESSAVNDNFGGGFSGKGQGQGGTSGRNQESPEPSVSVEYVDSLVAGIDIMIFGQLMAMGMLLAILASSVGLITILRYEPLKILSSRS